MHKKKKTHNVSPHICPTGCCTKQAGNPSEQESRSTISCFTVGQHRLPELSVRLCMSSAPKIGTSTNKIAIGCQSSLSGYWRYPWTTEQVQQLFGQSGQSPSSHWDEISPGKDEHRVVREAASAALPQHSSVISDFPTAAYIVLTWSSRERKLGTRRVQKYIEKRAHSGNHHDLPPKPI